jgi:mannosylglycoprotein endo-beta-mannosidase
MNDQILDSGWFAVKASELGMTVEQLSATRDKPAGAMPAIVPGTILTTLVSNGIYPDPYYGDYNSKIPDIYVEGREFYTYVFYKDFSLSALPQQSRAWLKLRGINYSADVCLNGRRLTATPIKGMFLRHIFDITDAAHFGGVNRLSVVVHPVDHPGDVSKGGQGGDHQIAQDVTAQYVEGWDWMMPIRDRNTGIWDQVAVATTGPVALRDPHIITTLDAARHSAELSVSVTLVNGSSATQLATVSYTVEGVTRSLNNQELKPRETREVALPTLTVPNPRLWWPNGLGAQELYTLVLNVTAAGHGLSDSDQVRFGIRQITSDISAKGGRVFRVNGEPLFIRGGNWIASDGMLRLSAERYRAEVRFHADMNLNMIRVWGGSIAERPEFYDACDKFGLLVMQEFWLTADNNGGNGRWPAGGDPTWPIDRPLYEECAADTVKMLRNHPSLCFWCGGNELDPERVPVAAEKRTREIVPKLDATRLYVRSSLADGLGPDDGPYGIRPPASFYTTEFASNPFNPEIGSVGTPNIETLQRFLPAAALEPGAFPVGKTCGGSMWKAHTYIPYSNGEQDQIAAYGEPKTAADFALRAQIVNYVQYRAMFEGYARNMWNIHSGVLAWKSQNPWTGLRGQFYDYYLDQTGGFFGVRKACEPVHIQLHLNDLTVGVINITSVPLKGLMANHLVYDYFSGALLTQGSHAVPSLAAHEKYVSATPIALPNDGRPIHFIRLVLMNGAAPPNNLSSNLYWRSSAEDEDFTAFQKLKLTPVRLSGGVTAVTPGADYVLTASIHNPANVVAFFIRLKLLRPGAAAGADARVLPSFYDDNYFTLLPGETRRISIRCARADAGNVVPQLWVEGWNITPAQIARGN